MRWPTLLATVPFASRASPPCLAFSRTRLVRDRNPPPKKIRHCDADDADAVSIRAKLADILEARRNGHGAFATVVCRKARHTVAISTGHGDVDLWPSTTAQGLMEHLHDVNSTLTDMSTGKRPRRS